LKEKDENKAEEETDTMICEEEEPSRHMSSDYENKETLEGISNVSVVFFFVFWQNVS
jgi:hypothetical protein